MTDELDLEELARRARSDPEAFGLLYDRLHDSVYRYVRVQVDSAQLAEDLCEGAFLAALESLGRYRSGRGGVRAWIMRIARNDVLDHFRRARRITFAPLDEAEGATAEGGPEEHSVREDEAERLRRAVGTLPDAQREVLLLKFAGGLSNAEVARVLGRTEGAVKALQHRALQALEARMRERHERS